MDRLWIFLLFTFTLVAYGGTDLQNEAYCKCLSPLGNGINFQGLTLVGGIYDHRRKQGYILKDLSEFPRELDTPWLIWELLNGLPGIPPITPWIRNKLGPDSGFMDGFPRRMKPRWIPMQELNPEWLKELEKVYCKCLSRQGYGINLREMMFGGIYDQSGNRGWLLRDLNEFPGAYDIQWVILKLLSGLPGITGNVKYPGMLRPLWLLWQDLGQLPKIPGTLWEELIGFPEIAETGWLPGVPGISGWIQTSWLPGVSGVSGDIDTELSWLPGTPGTSGGINTEPSGRPGEPDISWRIQTSWLPGTPGTSGGINTEPIGGRPGEPDISGRIQTIGGQPGEPNISGRIQTSWLPGTPGTSGGINTEPTDGRPGEPDISGRIQTSWLPGTPGTSGGINTEPTDGRPGEPDISGRIQTSWLPGVSGISGGIQTELNGFPGKEELNGGNGNGIIQSVLNAGEDVASKTGDFIHEIGETAAELKNSISLPRVGGEGNGIIQTILNGDGQQVLPKDIKGGIPASTATWSFQVGGNQPVNGLDLKEGTPGSTDIKGGIPGSTDIKEGTPSSTDIKGGTPGTTDIKGGTPGSSGSWSYQFGGNQPANGLDIKGGTPGSTGTWSFQFGGNQPVNGLDVKGGTPGSTDINGGISGSTDIKGGTPGSTDLNGGTPGSTATWSFQYGGNQPMNGLGLRRPSHGKYFVTAFMHNSFSNGSPSTDFLFTGTAPSTTVTVSISNSNFKKYVTVAKGETVTVQLPPATENRGSEIYPCGAIIKSDQNITVMSRNFKETSGDVALIYPVDQWGTVYYIITPTNGPSSHSTEFGVLASEFLTTVTIIFSGTVQFNGRYYQAGDILTINLQPFNFVQFQSKDDLSGTKVTSQFPVAVLAGHSCVPTYADCSHVYEQLQPFESWGTSFYVPGLSFQSNYDLVYVLAFKTTCLEYQSGEQKQKTIIEAGKLMKFEVYAYSSLSMHSLERIQVLLFGTGGKFRSRGFGPFLTKIPDIESFNLAYNIIGQEDFENNLAIIIAKTSSVSEITLNGENLRRARWTEFPQSEYSWLEYNYGMDSSSNTMQHSTTPFGLLSIGYTRNMAYGSVAPSTQGPGGQLPESKGVQVVKEERKGQRQGLLQSLLHVGGNIISNTGELVKGIGETAGDLKNSISGENHGLIPSVIDAGEEVMKETGGIINGIGDIFGGL